MVTLAGAVAGQNVPTSQIVDNVAQCRAVREDAERLRCFDRTTAALIDARDRKEVVVLDRENMREARRSVFGFLAPDAKIFGSRAPEAEVEVRTVEDSIKGVRAMTGNMWRFTLANGSVWQTTEGASFLLPKAGDAIRIDAGLLGSYSAKVGNRRPVRVKRVQ